MPASPSSADDLHKGRHHEFIKNTLHGTFKSATLNRGLALSAATLKPEAWYATSHTLQHDKLKAANLKAWASQNKVDVLLAKLDIYTFAAPLLQAKLKERCGVDIDVKTTWLRLYMPKDKPWWAIDISGGATARTVSLLDAALHNFAKDEQVDAASAFISKPDALGHFEVLTLANLSISEFQTLCRELDIGAQYKKHLESYLLSGDAVADAVLKHKVVESQKDALTVAAQLALITGDIQYDVYKLMLELTKDKPRLVLNGRRMQCCDLSMMDNRLTGITLLIPARPDTRGINRLIVYLPHGPDHPLKEYASVDAFIEELARQLREDKLAASSQMTYRQFFSQFVDQQQRGHFFASLEQRLFKLQWHPPGDPTDQRPTWRKEPVPRPRLQIDTVALPADYWRHVYQQKLNKILNDGREIAVSTADTDSNTRWAWWDNFKKIVSDIFNAALLIATPFVPFLGELMMAYTVYQLTSDVIEGIVDLAEGLGQEAAEHVISVVTDVIQLAAFSAGTAIGSTLRVKFSKLVDDMKPVRLPSGKASLWHPDLGPYEQKNLALSVASKPDRLGLHRHGNDLLLPLDGKLYKVQKATTEPAHKTHRIEHPSRANAYQPTLEHNDHGAWLHEAENPEDWSGPTLMRRLGHSVERFSPLELEQIRVASGTDAEELRRMHIDNSPPPPVLADTIKRYKAYDDADTTIADIRAGRPIDAQSVWFEPIITRLPGWPTERALRVCENADLSGHSRQYGNPAATEADTLSIGLPDLTAGRLPERAAVFLTDSEMRALAGREVPAAQRPQAMRNLLADAVDDLQGDLASRIYQGKERSNKADVRVMTQTFPDMPLSLAEKTLAQARPAELERIVSENRLPLRIKTQAREANFEATTARAYDGFYHDERVVPDTERLALNTLRTFSDSFGEMRLEVRDGTYDGPLRCSVGPDEPASVRRLIRDEHGRYEVLDGDNRTLQAPADFYEALLQALPEDKRQQIGYQKGQGRLLKLWIMDKTAAPAERRVLLAEPPVRPVASIETVELVRGWPWPFGEKTFEERIKQLFPKLNERQVNNFAEALRAKPDPEAALQQLKDQLKELRSTLARWRNSQPVGLDSAGEPIHGVSAEFLRTGGLHLEERLLDCFERKNEAFAERDQHPDQGYTLDLSSDLSRPDHDRWWNEMRRQPGMKKYLDQITALKIDNGRFSPDSQLLNDLPQLRQLSARQCGLNNVPSAIGEMRDLQTLDLTDNRIRLNDESAARLSGLTRLQSLRLTGNPLGQAPDVGRMYRLNELSLANSDIRDWPRGLFRVANAPRHRPRSFALDMRRSPITTVPEVTPGSDEAFILSRARFDTQRLVDADRIRYGNYRESAGFSRQQAYSPAVENEVSHWLSSDEPTTFSASQSLRRQREESWQDVMAEPGSEDLFRIIREQRESEDYRSERSRKRLTRRVWELIEAAALDTDLREQLFEQARAPETCQDGNAQLFNSMGLKVLVSKAYAERTSARTLDDNLVRLARSAARLERVGDIAREEVSRQQQRNLINPSVNLPPDQFEVHLAFETGLAERLGLPWQSDGMMYQLRSGVDQGMIDRAYDTIIERERGEGLANGMLDLYVDGFWERHLRRTHPTQFEANDQVFEEQHRRLEELRELQTQWVNTTDPTRLNPLARRMEALARQLNAREAEIFSGEVMSDAYYSRLLSDLAYTRNDLARQLTHKALQTAGLEEKPKPSSPTPNPRQP
ncbi:NEL-type E3 ubiquitin ligase domain-containing protein [Pseudomonas sp. NPDC087817]|uniref:NEL-type E3 ubiquitin ligase domain-containing protein n=1 Tax=Pseudomonas sp. NPDC087817 TaxID=3364451 RepID=UPI0038300EA8